MKFGQKLHTGPLKSVVVGSPQTLAEVNWDVCDGQSVYIVNYLSLSGPPKANPEKQMAVHGTYKDVILRKTVHGVRKEGRKEEEATQGADFKPSALILQGCSEM